MYLSGDKLGVVQCDAFAVSQDQMWRVMIRQDGCVLENVYGNFLKAEEHKVRKCVTFRKFIQCRVEEELVERIAMKLDFVKRGVFIVRLKNARDDEHCKKRREREKK